jgi:hypothetical protein
VFITDLVQGCYTLWAFNNDQRTPVNAYGLITRINGALRSLRIESKACNSINQTKGRRTVCLFIFKEHCGSVKRPCDSNFKELK